MKQTYIAVAVIFLTLNLSAQEIIWQKTIGGSGTDKLNCISKTTDGGYIMGGTSDSNISSEKSENSNGGDDYWVVKTDSLGNIQWQNTIGGSGSDECSWIEQAHDGGYIIGGRSNSAISGDKTENPDGGYDFWILKTDSIGNIQWQRTLGGTGIEEFFRIQPTYDGGYILGGESTSDSSADKLENHFGFTDYWVIKLDSSGNIQWENTIGGTGTDDFRTIEQTTDGGYIVGGSSSSPISADKTIDTIGSSDYWLVKLDSAGSILWQNVYGGSQYDFVKKIHQTNDGGYIISGVSTSPASGNKTESNFSGADPWIVKADSLGNIQWQDNIGAISGDFCEDALQLSNGSYLVGCWASTGIAGDRTVNSKGSDDFWVIKMDNTGQIMWQKSIGGTSTDVLKSLLEANNGQFILAGYSQSDSSADKSEDNRGYSDYWIMKFTDTYNIIKGTCFVDTNANGIMDAGELPVVNHVIKEVNSGRFSFTKPDGTYELKIPTTGNYVSSPDSLLHYSVVPTQQAVTFNSYPVTDSLNDFAFQPNGVVNDLRISLTAMNRFRPGFQGIYNIHYQNTGVTTQAATITFLADTGTTYDSASVAPAFSSPDSVVWQLPVLPPLTAGDISFTIDLNSSLTLIDTVIGVASIDPVAGDSTPNDNISVNYRAVTGSFDPNEILVSRDYIFTSELAAPPYLEYTILFQNTGTDTAFNIKINNPLPPELDKTTFEFLASSHPLIIDFFNPDGTIWFNFDNIQLPDSNINETASHGFVKYRIKPLTTLTFANHIDNQAFIYFDFNSSVATNIAATNILFPTGITALNSPVKFSLSPNPAGDEINIILPIETSGKVRLDIFDGYGRQVKSETDLLKSGKNILNITVSELPSGIFYLLLIRDGQICSTKFVKL